MDKIKITSVVEKKSGEKNGRAWVIWEIGAEGHLKSMDTFDVLEVGKTYEGEITYGDNPLYNPKFTLKKEPKAAGGKSNFAPRDYTFDKRRVALELAVALVNGGKIQMSSMAGARDKFFDYLNMPAK